MSTLYTHRRGWVGMDVNLCRECNFRCSYCYEGHEHSPQAVAPISEEVSARFVDYVKFMKGRLPETGITVQFYGGEPTLAFDRVEQIVRGLQDTVDELCIITNGSQVERLWPRILALSRESGGKLRASVSYDFTHQERKRHPGTYHTTRDAIRLMHAQGMMRKVITVFDKDTLPTMDMDFFDFIALRKECPGLLNMYNLSLSGDLSGFDEAATVKALEHIRDWLREHPEHHGSFRHNVFHGGNNHWRSEHCALCNIMSCTDTDGGLYSDVTALYQGEELRNTLHYGNIFEDFALLDSRQEDVIRGLGLSPLEKCRACTATCKVPMFCTLVAEGKRFHTPGEESCRIRRLIHSYMGEFR